jgi:hyaluronoglucosaminidase
VRKTLIWLMSGAVIALVGVAGLRHHSPAPQPSRHPESSAPVPKTRAAVNPPFMAGVVEGFYGHRWSVANTAAVLTFMGRQGLNTFVYAPKNDPYQRADWSQLYPPAQFQYIRQVVKAAVSNHVNFVYSISPGLSVLYSSVQDRNRLVAKVNQLRTLGVNTFMLSFDDIGPSLDATDNRVYHGNLAEAQAALANNLYSREIKADPAFRLILTPTYYYGLARGRYTTAAQQSYWQGLRRYLNPAVDVAWTGEWVLTASANGQQAAAFRRYVGHPVVFWDNYPVNDWTYVQPPHHPRLLMGPLTGRAANLPAQLAGYLLNPMLQARASEVALYTAAQYLHRPAAYNPGLAWHQAITLIGGPAVSSFGLLCEDARASFLAGSGSGDPVLTADLRQFAKDPGAPSTALLSSLQTRFQAMAAVSADLSRELPDHALYTEITPWANQLTLQGEAGLAALAVIRARLGGQSTAPSIAQLTTFAHTMSSTPYVLDTTVQMKAFVALVLKGS